MYFRKIQLGQNCDWPLFQTHMILHFSLKRLMVLDISLIYSLIEGALLKHIGSFGHLLGTYIELLAFTSKIDPIV